MSLFLQAFQGTNKRIPVWVMRQAGRYLPEYMAIKAKHTLVEMFQTPEVAAEITLQPLRLIGVDAAILFADILTMPMAIGFDIDFVNGRGPVVHNPITKKEDIDHIRSFEGIDYLAKTIQLINQELSSDKPLIGFAGAPFTVAHYLIEGKSILGLSSATRLAYACPETFHRLMRKLTDNTIAYLNFQKQAGIKAFQLFDTQAGTVRQEDYQTLVLPYVQEIFNAVDLPSIYYLKHCSHVMAQMDQCGANGLSVCESVTIGSNPVLNKTDKLVQGNFFNGLLYADQMTIQQELDKLLTAAKATHKKYVFNLSHGMLPDMDPEKLKFIVNYVQDFNWS